MQIDLFLAMCLKIPPAKFLNTKCTTEIVWKTELPPHGENSPTTRGEGSV